MEDISALQAEIATLRESLNEAHDICVAIRHDDVDAMVVGKSDDEKRVLLLSGAYTRYRQLVDEMQQGAVTVSLAGEILFANNAFAQMLGVPLDKLISEPLSKNVAFEDRPKLASLLGTTTPRSIGLSLTRADSSRAPAQVTLVESSDEFVTLLITDLSRRPDQEAMDTLAAIRSGAVDAFVVDGKEVVVLDTAKSPYRALAERMRQGAVTVDAAGVVVYANERFVSAIAMPSGRILGGELANFISESDRAAYQGLLSSRENTHGELKLRAANGTRPVMHVTVTILVDGHKLFLFADMTEQKRHEASDERTRKFLGMLAHEFRNILGPINNSVVLLKQAPALDEDGKKAVDLIERQAGRLLALVEDLRRINPRE